MKRVEQRALEKLNKREPSTKELQRLLLEACRKGWVEVVREVLRRGIDPNFELDGECPLGWASVIGRDYVDAVRLLLDADADPNERGLMRECGVKSLPLLVEAGGRVNGNSDERNPLLYAIGGRTKEDKALALIEAGADVNFRASDGQTPLMLAATYGRNEVFDALVEAGADLMAVDNCGRSVLRHALETLAHATATSDSNRRRTVVIVRKMRDLLPAQPEDVVLVDLVLGDAATLRSRLQNGLGPNTVIAGSIGILGMSLATFTERVRQTGDLFEAMPGTEEIDDLAGGSTLLMWAVVAKHPECVQLLLDAGADPHQANWDGVSAASLSVSRPDRRIQHLLGTATTLLGEDEEKNRVRPELQAALPGARVERLGIIHRDALETLERQLRWLDEQANKVQGVYGRERRPIEGWKTVSIAHVLECSEKIPESLERVVHWTNELLSGEWRQKPDSLGDVDPPNEQAWRRRIEWVDQFVRGCAAAAVLRDWNALERICQYADEDCHRGERSTMYNMEWFDWPFWILFARRVRGDGKSKSLRDAILSESGRRAKMLLPLDDAIVQSDPKQFRRALGKYMTYHRSCVLPRNEFVRGEEIVSPEATLMLALAEREGIEIELKENELDFVLPGTT
jgi:ankyrin repeat protein